MFVELDEAAVPRADWKLAKAGNGEACARIRKSLEGVQLYTHVLSTGDDDVLVSIRELREAGCIDSVVVKTDSSTR